ncbi:hypothetical protein TIFTF001_006506 [Ficus carica]|uniref:Uncharacterized protein n=1 Tax=Ficus carica TaxID=3494 RepID=A0AA87ZN52_FICCA|nr:hypothetical protein TIFTF001_006506 [Ficus carica]
MASGGGVARSWVDVGVEGRGAEMAWGMGSLSASGRGGGLTDLAFGVKGRGGLGDGRRHRGEASSLASGVGGADLVGGRGPLRATRRCWGGLVASVGEGGAYHRLKVVKIPAISALMWREKLR